MATNGLLSTYYIENGWQYPIYVQIPESMRKTADQIALLPISAVTTPIAPAGTFTETTTGPQQHGRRFNGHRRKCSASPDNHGANRPCRFRARHQPDIALNQQRYIAITGNIVDRAQSAVMSDVTKIMDGMHLPTGLYWQFGIQQQQQSQEFAGLYLAVFLAIALIYMLLASQFESFIFPLVVLMSVPSARSGFCWPCS